MIRRVPSSEPSRGGNPAKSDHLLPHPAPAWVTQIYCLPFQLLKANCNGPAQLTLNKPALCPVPLPGPLLRAAWPSLVSNARLGQTRAGSLTRLEGGPPLARLQRASFGRPGIQLPSLEWAPASWPPLTATEGRADSITAGVEEKQKSVKELPLPAWLLRRERAGGCDVPLSFTGFNSLARFSILRRDGCMAHSKGKAQCRQTHEVALDQTTQKRE